MNKWKNNELGYLLQLVSQKGDSNVGHDSKVIASYLRLQSTDASKFNRDLANGIGRAAIHVENGQYDAAYDCLRALRRAEMDSVNTK